MSDEQKDPSSEDVEVPVTEEAVPVEVPDGNVSVLYRQGDRLEQM